MRQWILWAVRAGCAVCVAHAALVLAATQPATDPINEARDALRKRDAKRLLTLRNSTRAEAHPLAPWVDYWEIGNRISDVRSDEVEAFYQRWSGSYV
ncbi:MAG TPA: lytic transglycosylase domain-containing protein, partial [Burkholderiaceae bacterium]|nr:lytic transglycosylase domain-containing protein [Burkholderiaceae bacterium]